MKQVWFKGELINPEGLPEGFQCCGVIEVEDITPELVQQAAEACYITATNVIHYHEVGVGCPCEEHE